jgi:hypothetical protein
LRSSLGQGRGGGQQDEQAAVDRSAQEGHAVPPKRQIRWERGANGLARRSIQRVGVGELNPE